jgi:amphi-Trp domain-containing protein
MTDFKHSEKARVSRQQAAERLVDLAYMLTTGRALELSVDGEKVRVPIPERLVFERESKSEGDHVELDVELSWSSGAPEDPEITQNA